MTIRIGFVDELNIDSRHVRHFYEKSWSRKIALSDESFYKWQFQNTPTQYGKDYCVVAYNSAENQILGVMGLNKRPFIMSKKLMNGAELTTWIVSNESRGLGLGAKILLYIQSNFDVLIGMGISSMALPIYMRCGFRYLKNIPRYIKVINFESIKSYATYDSLAPKLIKLWKNKNQASFFVTEAKEDDIGKANKYLESTFNHFSRNSRQLDWRYQNHPYFTYKQFIVKLHDNKHSDGVYVCLREESALNEFRMLHVMDIFGNNEAIPSAITFIESYAHCNNFDVIDFYCTSSAISCHLMEFGWFSISDDMGFQFPHLFHPVEMRNPPTTSLVYWSKENLTDISNLSKLYVTKEDADLDRPTGFSIEKERL